jgi:alpha-L-fucosidase
MLDHMHARLKSACACSNSISECPNPFTITNLNSIQTLKATDCPKSLAELIGSYHNSIGHNAYWLMDWTPTQDGVVRPDHVKRYGQLGSWLAECYGSGSVATVTNSSVLANGTVITIPLPPGSTIDRVRSLGC